MTPLLKHFMIQRVGFRRLSSDSCRECVCRVCLVFSREHTPLGPEQPDGLWESQGFYSRRPERSQKINNSSFWTCLNLHQGGHSVSQWFHLFLLLSISCCSFRDSFPDRDSNQITFIVTSHLTRCKVSENLRWIKPNLGLNSIFNADFPLKGKYKD